VIDQVLKGHVRRACLDWQYGYCDHHVPEVAWIVVAGVILVTVVTWLMNSRKLSVD